jgi:NADH-quinone oxidoreductase subunit E
VTRAEQQRVDTASGELSASAKAAIDRWLAKYPKQQRRSAVIAALTIAQDENGGWLTTELMDAVADYLDIPRVAVYEVGTFYSMFDLEPVGRHKISVCTNISCMLCGADDIVEHIERRLGIRLGQTTPDGRITLKVEEECLAACGGGPMMTVDGHYYERLTPETIDQILDGLD